MNGSETSVRAPVIRPITEADWPGAWSFMEPVVRDQETFPYDEPGARSVLAGRQHRYLLGLPKILG
ncbi:MAG: hypothetical protein GEU98_02510 [Pseudonocardiaceae bacterium]|nr:hypothetical protein [Pseudonocardiaceae bacterium]